MIDTQVTFRPIAGRILIRMIEPGETRPGSLIIRPQETHDMPNEAVVVVTSETNKHRLKPGDHIAVGKYSGADIQIGDEKLRILFEDDVLGVFDASS